MAPEEIVVVGSGIAGLTAAVHLAERGVPVLVLEADALYPGGRLWGGRPHSPPRPGEGVGGEVVTLRGVTRTFHSEHGIHGFWNSYANLRATLERFGIAPDLILSEEEDWIHGEDEWVRRAEVGTAISTALLPPPLHYLNLFTRPDFLAMLGLRDWLALPSVWASLVYALALDPFGRNLALAGQSIDAFFRGWSPRLRALFVGLARSGLAAPPEQISLAAFIAALRFYTLFRRDALRFSYVTTDFGTALIQPLIERLRALGGEVMLGALVDDITPLPSSTSGALGTGQGVGGWRVRFQTSSGARTFQAAHVVLAVDPPAARRLLCASAATRLEAEKLTWPEGLPNAIVRLWFDIPPRPGPQGGVFSGDFVVDNYFWLQRIHTEFADWARLTGGSAIEMHLYRPAEYFAQPDAVILAQAISDLGRAWPELRGHGIHQMLQRNPAAHTRLIVDRPERWLGVRPPWPNLWLCGDWVRGPWPALFIERACVSGIEAANAALTALGREPFPVMPYPEPEWLAGQIQKGMLRGREWVRRLRRKR